jgi:hypothetical protein
MEMNVVMVKLWKRPVGYLSWDKKSETAFLNMNLNFWTEVWLLLL